MRGEQSHACTDFQAIKSDVGNLSKFFLHTFSVSSIVIHWTEAGFCLNEVNQTSDHNAQRQADTELPDTVRITIGWGKVNNFTSSQAKMSVNIING